MGWILISLYGAAGIALAFAVYHLTCATIIIRRMEKEERKRIADKKEGE